MPLLRERRFTTDRAGQPVEWSDDRYLSTETAFSVRNSITVNALSRTPPPAQGNPGHPERTLALPSVRPLSAARARHRRGRARRCQAFTQSWLYKFIVGYTSLP